MDASDTDIIPGQQKESAESDKGEQLTALVKDEDGDLFHIGYSEGKNRYSALENHAAVSFIAPDDIPYML